MIRLKVEQETARFIDPSGRPGKGRIEIRTCPVTGRTARIAHSRAREREPGTADPPPRPPEAEDRGNCPFCRPQVMEKTPRLIPELAPGGRLVRGDSLLFPNLFPYGPFSAVSLFGDDHFVPIGTARADQYADGFRNCADYLRRVLAHAPAAVHLAVTQNHLPSAGGSLVHPHLQIQAESFCPNHHRFLAGRAAEHRRRAGGRLFSDLLAAERASGRRYIGATGPWEWTAAFAPEGFYEIWGILPGAVSIPAVSDEAWGDLAQGVLNAQRFYRSLNRNGYNLGLLSVEAGDGDLELRAVLRVRPNYAPWTRGDFTGFDLMLGEMATFTAPERIAETARPFWADDPDQAGGAGA